MMATAAMAVCICRRVCTLSTVLERATVALENGGRKCGDDMDDLESSPEGRYGGVRSREEEYERNIPKSR